MSSNEYRYKKNFKEIVYVEHDLYDQDTLCSDDRWPNITISKIPGDFEHINNLKDTLYDTRMGAFLEGQLCLTCRQTVGYCPTHPGKINLRIPIYNVPFMDYILFLMRIFDFEGFLENPNDPLIFLYDITEVEKRLINAGIITDIIEIFKKLNILPDLREKIIFNYKKNVKNLKYPPFISRVYLKKIKEEEESKTLDIINIFDILEFLRKIDSYRLKDGRRILEIIGFGETQVRFYIIYCLYVYPPLYRKQQQEEIKTTKDMINTFYSSIIKENNFIKEGTYGIKKPYIFVGNKNLPEYRDIKISEKLEISLKKISHFYELIINNRQNKNSSLGKYIGSGKETNLLRGFIESFTCTKVSRSVIVPNDDLEPDQILVGYNEAKKWTTGIVVTADNRLEIDKLIIKGYVKTWINDLGIKSKIKKTPIIGNKFKPIFKNINNANIIIFDKPYIKDTILEINKVETAKKYLMISDFYKYDDQIIPTGGKIDIKGRNEQEMREYIEELEKREKQFNFFRSNGIKKFEFFRTKEYIYHIPALKEGNIIYRMVQDDDIGLFNRQPTLHKGSEIALRLKITKPEDPPLYSFEVNTSICESLKLDFDGDSANFHIAQSQHVMDELRNTAFFKRCMRSSATGKIENGFVQDAILSFYELSKEYSLKIKKEYIDEFINDRLKLLDDYGIPNSNFTSKFPIKRFKMLLAKYNIPYASGRALISTILPRDLTYSLFNIIIKEGILIKGDITSEVLQGGKKSLLHHMILIYGEDVAMKFLSNGYKLSAIFMEKIGFTVSYKDCELDSKDTEDILVDLIKRFMTESFIKDNLKDAKIDIILGNIQEMGLNKEQAKEIISYLENRYNDKIIDELYKYFNKNKTKKEISIQLSSLLEINKESISDIFDISKDISEKILDNANLKKEDLYEGINTYITERIPFIMSEIKKTRTIPIKKLEEFSLSQEHLTELIEALKKTSIHIKIGEKESLMIQKIENIHNNGGILSNEEIEKKCNQILENYNSDIMRSVKSSINPGNNLLAMVKSGSKGNEQDLRKIMGSVAQNFTLEGKRPPDFNIYNAKLGKYLKRGFISENYTGGLDVKSHILTEMITRPQVVNTYVTTPTVGYASRQLTLYLGSVVVTSGGQIKINSRLVLPVFGRLSFSIEKTIKIDEKTMAIDPIDLLIQINK